MICSTVIFSLLVSVNAFAPQPRVFQPLSRPLSAARSTPVAKLDSRAAGLAAASLLAASVATTAVEPVSAHAMYDAPMTVAVKETREGVYGTYEVEIKPQDVDDAAGTFKSKDDTVKGKKKYIAVLGVLLFGSFVIPMLQYFWYVRED
uniref:Uncharacterized protein n=1 Tax=Octactis speculum TaxID=3111310 RepID=A0A7S2B691_9STRA|mmetsp:Transcript_20049/g.27189  ORF Transcript_20049/g.27189 Transcript_20049/m.27189 type:complete len:148 (+) Transcript_20049:47-490(+)|eukprot:CAMPEP_0185769900 /NCGR_PEP_ID=MMETSP1174-20130828/56480_1 /TAXON_ID=35687 /ORGANISM="Dictyocha speculum, Strain CCMP1381" /LENGTH=147 /DNA_ID=CAMNT_0028455139 /DNA_START=38 /DNA_END=481 /DNA_ORIENTATION=+